MIIYLCIKFESNTLIFSKDIKGKPFLLRTDRTDRTDVRTDSGGTICPPSPHPPKVYFITCWPVLVLEEWQTVLTQIRSRLIWVYTVDPDQITSDLGLHRLLRLCPNIYNYYGNFFLSFPWALLLRSNNMFSWQNKKNITSFWSENCLVWSYNKHPSGHMT